MFVIITQLVLLLCAWRAQTQDFTTPKVDILAELAKIKNLEERLKTIEETMEQLKRENGVLKTTVQTLQDKDESLQNENEARKVAFSASLLASGQGHEGPHGSVLSPLIYKKVVTNIGNGYDSDTGIFTAPVKGVYYIRFYAHCHPEIRMAVSLYKNGNVQCSVYSEKPVTNGNANNGIVLNLEKGDQLYTKLWDNSWVYDDPAGYTSFGGFLLFPL
ncbi:hypothetical protein AMELA_G00067360 [Ameiurus melas]|uniref:C1q domain-containing protein n=1 Tax=Ameiurus melas TaxID=219545 RepID=A0A7J6B378_AMEME|nr:hypothetical protein AMELA_G00067360 [Ameiurus melas]